MEGKHFATLVKGRGRAHRASPRFKRPFVRADDGPPRVELSIPKVPGVAVRAHPSRGARSSPHNPVTTGTSRTRGNTTVATVHVPLTEQGDA